MVLGDLKSTSTQKGVRLFILGGSQWLALAQDTKQPDSDFCVGQGQLEMSTPVWTIVWCYFFSFFSVLVAGGKMLNFSRVLQWVLFSILSNFD